MRRLMIFFKRNIYYILILMSIGFLLLTLNYYNNEYTVNKIYSGIKYQSNNSYNTNDVVIEIRGAYLRGLLGKTDSFEGEIFINDDKCYSKLGDGSRGNKYSFSKEKMSYIETDSFEGFIFVDNYMNNITITLDKFKNTNNQIYSFNNGWLISAPCNNRNDAVDISNKLIQKLHKGVRIK